MMTVLPERHLEMPAVGCQTVPVPPLARFGSSGAEPPRPSVSLPPSPAGSLPAGAPLPCFLSRRLPLLAPSLNSLDGSGLGEAASSALLGGTSPSPGEALIGSVRGDSPASVLEGAPPGGP